MKYRFYTNSDSSWNGITEAIQKAQSLICLEMYIFVDDTQRTKDLVELISQKARSGVKVKIVLDAFGSSALSDEARKNLTDAGVEILFFRKWFRRLHKKILIIDRTVGFLGGVNIHESARWWNDLFVKFEGPIVRSLARSFRRTYKICGGKDQEILSYTGASVLGHTQIWLFEHVPGLRRPRLKDLYTDSIQKAEKHIVLITPYFLPHKWLITLLIEAVKKGITVSVIVPKKTDVPFISNANLYYVNLLAHEGVVFYLTSRMNHAKVMLIDDSLALVGSQNIDSLSFDFNSEAGVLFTDKDMLSSLRVIISKWKEEASIFTAKKITFRQKIFSYIVRLFQPLL